MSSKSLPPREGDRVAYDVPQVGLRPETRLGTVVDVIESEVHGTEVLVRGEGGRRFLPVSDTRVLFE